MSEVHHFRREPRFVRERFDDIARRGSEYLVKDMIPAHGFGYLGGPSGSYKTFLALDLSLAITQGASVLGHRTRACGVVYVAAEAPNGVRKRIEAWRRRNPARGLPFELIGQSPNLRDDGQIQDLAAELRIAADEMASEGHRLGLIVVDTFAASAPGVNENLAADVSPVLSNVTWLGSQLDAFVLIVTHTGKEEAKGLRGWSGQFAGADCVIMLTREDDNTLGLGRIAKLKDGEAGQQFAIRLEREVLGLDDDGDEISSAVVVYQDAPEGSTKTRKQRALNPGETIVLAAAAHVTDHGETHSIPSTVQGAKLWMKAVTRADVRARAMASGFADPGDQAATVRQQFSRALKGLVAASKVRVEEEMIWLL